MVWCTKTFLAALNLFAEFPYFCQQRKNTFLLEEITSFFSIYMKANSKHIALLPQLPDYYVALTNLLYENKIVILSPFNCFFDVCSKVGEQVVRVLNGLPCSFFFSRGLNYRYIYKTANAVLHGKREMLQLTEHKLLFPSVIS